MTKQLAMNSRCDGSFLLWGLKRVCGCVGVKGTHRLLDSQTPEELELHLRVPQTPGQSALASWQPALYSQHRPRSACSHLCAGSGQHCESRQSFYWDSSRIIHNMTDQNWGWTRICDSPGCDSVAGWWSSSEQFPEPLVQIIKPKIHMPFCMHYLRPRVANWGFMENEPLWEDLEKASGALITVIT